MKGLSVVHLYSIWILSNVIKLYGKLCSMGRLKHTIVDSTPAIIEEIKGRNEKESKEVCQLESAKPGITSRRLAQWSKGVTGWMDNGLKYAHKLPCAQRAHVYRRCHCIGRRLCKLCDNVVTRQAWLRNRVLPSHLIHISRIRSRMPTRLRLKRLRNQDNKRLSRIRDSPSDYLPAPPPPPPPPPSYPLVGFTTQ